MQKCVITILVVCLFQSTLCFNAARCDPLTLALEQILSDITFEIVPYPTSPNCYYDVPSCPYGVSIAPSCPNFYMDPPCQYNPYSPICPNSGCNLPYDPCYQCGDIYPTCSCYRDIINPCNIYEDSPPLYICFEGCSCEYIPHSPPPYIYFPEVEYPMTAMDLRPYYYGSCWCS